MKLLWKRGIILLMAIEQFIIYKTSNLINGKIYIGQHRVNNMADMDSKYYGSGKYLKKAIKKYGKNNFSREIIALCGSREITNILEIEYIKIYKDIGSKMYNVRPGGMGFYSGGVSPFKGRHHGEESKKKLSEGRSGKRFGPHLEETKKKIGEANRCRVWKEESRIKIGEKAKIINSGIIRSEATKHKMSEAAKKRWANYFLQKKEDLAEACNGGF
jgi:group I intron endonuclease